MQLTNTLVNYSKWMAACGLLMNLLGAGQAHAVEIRGLQAGRWTLAASPYIVMGDVEIPAGRTLTLEPGVVVQFAGDYSIQVNGTLNAQGRVSNQIIFTSSRDRDFFLLQSNSREEPSGSDWSGIVFNAASQPSESYLENVIIRYCKSPMVVNQANPTLRNVTIRDCDANIVMINGRFVVIADARAKDYNIPRPSETTISSTSLARGQLASLNPGAAGSAALIGNVFDAETGEGLPGANIIISPAGNPDVQAGAASSATGQFNMLNLPPDRYSLTVTYIGYDDKVLSRVELAADETVSLDIPLHYTGIQFSPITVTASRHAEPVLKAPASVNIIEAEQLEARPVMTPADYLVAMPAVDIVSSGLNQRNVVVRGFNNVFSGALLSLVDNRIAHVPSIRYNAYSFIPIIGEDLDRIEVVSGPGSALYGPNTANGMLHLMTKSPFGSEGTKVSVGTGERNVFMSSFRHAGSLNNRIGYKFSSQYSRGNDWEYNDPAEPDSILVDGIKQPAPERNFLVERVGGDARVDFHLSEKASFIFSGGANRASSIELTGIGAGQAKDWMYSYIQGRFYYKSLFAQAFINKSDAGESFVLRTGDKIVDKSSMMVGQVQHGFMLGSWQRFTYGMDALLTRPNTEGTITGRNEHDDNIDEYGAYIQSETSINPSLSVVGALRVDDHNRLKDKVLSPRAAVLYQPNADHTIRATFNQAFSTPTSNDLFLDILSGSLPTASVNPALAPVIGGTIFNVRARGTWPGGFTFRYGADGRPKMVSLYGGALAQAGAIPSPNTYLSMDVNSVWPAIRQLAIGKAPPDQQALLNSVLPLQLSQTVPGSLGMFNTVTQTFDPVDASVIDGIDPTQETRTTTYELGYKGYLGRKFFAGLDVYHSRIKNFVGPLRVETPNVFINPETFVPALAADIAARGVPLEQAVALATNIAQTFAPLPIGLISPSETHNPTDIILTYRNFGDVSLTGADFSLAYYPNQYWTLSMNYSFVNRDIFRNVGGLSDIALNAPKHKIGASIWYYNPIAGRDAQVRFRQVESFPVNSGVYVGRISAYSVFDVMFGFYVAQNTKLTLSVDNLFDNRHREIVGAPEIGRLGMIRLTQGL